MFGQFDGLLWKTLFVEKWLVDGCSACLFWLAW